MRTYEASASISAPRAAVWRALSDVVAWPDWLPTVTGVEPLDGRELQAGRRYRIRQPRLRPTTWMVTELEPPRRFAWVAQAPGVRMTAEHSIAEEAGGTSRVLLRFSFAGPFGGLVARLFRSITESYLAREAAALRGRVEAADASR